MYCPGSDAAHWISNRDGPVPDSELLSLLDEVKLSGEELLAVMHNALLLV